jgi:hypothetical protein
MFYVAAKAVSSADDRNARLTMAVRDLRNKNYNIMFNRIYGGSAAFQVVLLTIRRWLAINHGCVGTASSGAFLEFVSSKE